MKRICIAALMMVVSAACEPDEDYYTDFDYSKLAYLIADNYNLSTFSAGLKRTGFDQILMEQGPYTVLVPSDEAFLSAGIGYDRIMTMPGSQLANMFGYHILDGLYELDKLPFLFNQEVITRGGDPVYITRWVKDQDTVITVNGGTVHLRNIPASNGIAQVIDRVLASDVKKDVVDIISSRDELTLFAEAVRRAGLENTLRQLPSCTVFVPSNTAMASYGLSTVQQIHSADRETMARLVRYHVLPDRRFVNDFNMTIIPTLTGSFQVDYYNGATNEIVRANAPGAKRGSLIIRMLDGNRLTATYTSGIMTVVTTAYPGIRLSIKDLTGGESIVSVANRDHVSHNGLVHVIDRVLR